MRSLGGFVLLAGIGVGLFVYFPAPVDRSTTLEGAERALAERAADAQVRVASPSASSAASRLAGFSPSVKLNAPQARSARVAVPPSTAPAAARVETIANWQGTVTSAGSGALEPTDADARYKLVVDIQQNLKRVGCYWGRVNGAWNANTREAMRQFTTQSNAALPVEKPDYMLLSLLKSHSGRSCGAPETTVAATAPPAEALPWKAPGAPATQPGRLFTPVASSVVTNEPLPGRMTIGGPKDFPAATREPLVPGTSQPSVATAALDADASPVNPGYSAPAAAPRPRPSKKASSGSNRRVKAGTPRYNLMLSLGGVY
jgi:hypothetical protein